MNTEMTVAGRRVLVVRRRQKHMYLRVKSGYLLVTAPTRTSLNTVRSFVLGKEKWIRDRINSGVQDRPAIVPGKVIKIWGEDVRLVHAQSASIHLGHVGQGRALAPGYSLSSGVLTVYSPHDRGSDWERACADAFSNILLEVLSQLRHEWEPKMGGGPRRYSLRNMKTRWGSARVDGERITINTRLVHYPRRSLEYVLVHELAHLHVPNHGTNFYAMVDRFLPDWQCRRSELNTLDRETAW